MRKTRYLLLFAIFLIFSLSLVSADIFSTITTQGLSFADPKIGSMVSGVVCVANPISCVSGQITGAVQSGAISSLTKQNPEAAQAISVFNQVKGYTNQGAEITKNLALDNQGQIQEGTLKFKDKEAYFGNLVGKDIKQNEIFGKQLDFDKKDSVSTVTFTGEDSYVNVKNNLFKNIKKQDKDTQSYLKLDEKGEVTDADFTTNEKGGTYNLGNYRINAPPNSHITFSNGKTEVSVPDKTVLREEDLPTLVDSSVKSGVVTFNVLPGETLELPRGNVLQQGELIIDNGRIYLGGNSIRIDNLGLGLPEGTRERVFFDGQAHDAGEDYLSLNADNKNMYLLSKDQSIESLNFNEDNPFVNVQDAEHFDLATINNEPHSLELGISNSFPDKIPELNVKSFSGDANINNGEYGFFPSKQGDLNVFTSTVYSTENTVPMNIKFQDNNLLPAGKDLLIEKDNSYTLIRENNPLLQKYLSLDYQMGGGSDSQKLALIDKIQKETPWIKYEGMEKVSLAQLQGYDEEISQMTDSLKKATTSVEFVPQNLLDSQGNVVRGISDLKGKVRLSSDFLGLSPETATHEFSHDFDGAIMRDPVNQLISPADQLAQMHENLANQVNEIFKKNGVDSLTIKPSDIIEDKEGQTTFDYNSIDAKKLLDLPESVKNNMWDKFADQNNLKAIKASKFDQDWINMQGEGYQLSIGQSTGSVLTNMEWGDKTDGPRNGFISPYGSSNHQEDIATYVQKADRDPAFFKPLLDPNSKQFDSRYQQKLSLLRQRGFISADKYHEILNLAGLSK